MRIFEIRDDELPGKILGWLLYYEQPKSFYIELPEQADEWETPLILSSFAKRGEYSVNAYWSMLWVRQRIVPQDRQNLGQILRDNGLKEYDELRLLLLGHGRCAQDNVYITETDDLPEALRNRWLYKVEDVVPLPGFDLAVFFRDGSARRIHLADLVGDRPAFLPVMRNPEIFDSVTVQPGGHGIAWGDSAVLADHDIYARGLPVPLSLNDIKCFISGRIVSTAEAQQMLHCTRQNIADLIARDKLHPIRTDEKNRLFLKTEIQQRMGS